MFDTELIVRSHSERDCNFIRSVLLSRNPSERAWKNILRWLPLTLIIEFFSGKLDRYVLHPISIYEIRKYKDTFTKVDWERISGWIEDKYIPEFTSSTIRAKGNHLSVTGLSRNRGLSLQSILKLRKEFTKDDWKRVSEWINLEWVNYFLDYIDFSSLFRFFNRNRKISKEDFINWSGYYQDWNVISEFIDMDLVDDFEKKIVFSKLAENMNLTSKVILKYHERFTCKDWVNIFRSYSCDVLLVPDEVNETERMEVDEKNNERMNEDEMNEMNGMDNEVCKEPTKHLFHLFHSPLDYSLYLDSLSRNSNLKPGHLRILKDKFNKEHWKNITLWIPMNLIDEFDSYLDLEEASLSGTSLEFIRRHKEEFTREQWYNIFEWCRYDWVKEFQGYVTVCKEGTESVNGMESTESVKNIEFMEDVYIPLDFMETLYLNRDNFSKEDWKNISSKLDYHSLEQFHDYIDFETYKPIARRVPVKLHYKKFEKVMEQVREIDDVIGWV